MSNGTQSIDVGPKDSPEKIMGSLLTRVQERPQKLAPLQEDLNKADIDLLKAQEAKQLGVEKAQVAGKETGIKEQERLIQDFDTKVAGYDIDFKPTPTTVNDIAGLFSLMAVTSMFMGGSGRNAAQGAMSAMSGMMDGYRKGRDDLYKREKDKFEKDFKAMQEKVKQAREALGRELELSRQKGDLAGQNAAIIAAEQGGQGVFAAQLKKGQKVQAYENALQLEKSLDSMLPKMAEMTQKERIEQLKLGRQDLEVMRDPSGNLVVVKKSQLPVATDTRGLVSIKGTSGKQEKTPTDVEKDIKSNALFLNKVEDIADNADKLKASGNIRGIGVVQGKIPYDVAQLYMTNQEKEFLQDFQALSNQKLKDQSGATVTGQEFARQRGVLPLRDDTIDTVITKLRNWRREVAADTAVLGRAYPTAIRKFDIVLDLPKDKSRLIPNMEYNTPQGKLLWDGNEFVAPSGE